MNFTSIPGMRPCLAPGCPDGMGGPKRRRHFVVLGGLLLALSALPALAQNYTVTNMGTLGGPSAAPFDINASGEVTGYSFTSAGKVHAFFWAQPGPMVDLGTLGGSHSYARAINVAGQVVGYSLRPGDSSYHAFSWTQSGGMVDLGTLGGSHSFAFDVNDSGQVVGYSLVLGNSAAHAFLWTPGGPMVDLGTLGGTNSVATGINSYGQVVGYSDTAGNSGEHAFSWTQGGGMVDLGTLGGTTSYARSVNDSGQVVGYSYAAGTIQRAFSWTTGGGMMGLGTLGGTHSAAIGVNASGQVTGYGQDNSGSYHAFSWTQGGGMVDLGTLGGSYSFPSDFPSGINSPGRVVGYSATAGSSAHAFLWTPPGPMVDLNTLIPTAPPGLELDIAHLISDSGLIVATSNVGLVALGAISNAPVAGPISANDPVSKGSTLLAEASFTDADTSDTHTAVWTWGDGSNPEPGAVSGSGTASGSHAYDAAGVYTISLTIMDGSGLTATVSREVVVYDPGGGFVTGGGWIVSPPGAFKSNASTVGRATFAFVSKYQKGATQPTGNTEFRFLAADLDFHSETYDWLVVAGARAQYKGTGTINGQGSYSFHLTAIDGDILGTSKADRFRIKIWYFDTSLDQDLVVYDNQLDDGSVGTNGEGTLLGGGSVVIHQ